MNKHCMSVASLRVGTPWGSIDGFLSSQYKYNISQSYLLTPVDVRHFFLSFYPTYHVP